MPNDLLTAAQELLRLKDLHDRIEAQDFATWEGYTAAKEDYRANKAKAWDLLRYAVAKASV